MIMNKILILLTIFIISCSGPAAVRNVTDQKLYQQHHDWCMSYGTINRQPVYTETYQQCMERFGYKF